MLGILTLGNRNNSPTQAMLIAGINLLLLAIGVVSGFIALAGMRKWGRRGVLIPASFGLAFSGIILGAAIYAVMIQRDLINKQKLTRAQQIVAAEKEGQDAALQPGWFGALNDGELVISIASIPNDTSMVKELSSELKTRFSVMILSAQNSSTTRTRLIDTSNAVVYFQGNQSAPALDAKKIFAPLQSSPAAKKLYSPPYTIAPQQQLAGKAILLNPATDFSRISHLTVTVDGKVEEIQGSYISAQEKQKLYDLGRAEQEKLKQTGGP
jgi:hypothetical protein